MSESQRVCVARPGYHGSAGARAGAVCVGCVCPCCWAHRTDPPRRGTVKPLPSSVAFHKLLNLTEPQFLHLENTGNENDFLKEWQGG